MIKTYIALFLKGLGMGAANVVPGVSGGTIALITGIFERLINAIKSFNLMALSKLFKGDLKGFAAHIDLWFLVAVLSGVAVSILSFARLFDYLFINYPVFIWSYFFGLIIGSIYFVGKTVQKWSPSVIIAFIVGAALAVSISVMTPASEDSGFVYLLICGVVAACSMILPGLSGSFVLILMGNYQLVMIDAVNNLDLGILLPVVIGAGVGLLGFSYILSWVFRKFRDQTISVLTGFILGSLGLLWPWKENIYKLDPTGELLLKANGEKIVEGYRWLMPENFTGEVIFAVVLMVVGIATIWMLEVTALKKEKK